MFDKAVKTIKSGVNKNLAPIIKTGSDFMRFLAAVHGEFQEADKNLSVGILTVCIDTFAQILMLLNPHWFVKVALFALSKCEAVKEAYGDIYSLTGTGKYIPIKEFNACKDNKALKLVLISKNIEKALFEQLPLIDLNDPENLRMLLRDINDCGRMWQEESIDAAKKLYDVIALFYQAFLRAESTIHYMHNFQGFKRMEKAFAVERNTMQPTSRKCELGDSLSFYDTDGNEMEPDKIYKAVFKDNLAVIQDKYSAALEELVNETGKAAYNSTKFNDSTIADMDLNGFIGNVAKDMFEYIFKPYCKVVSAYCSKKDVLLNDDKLSSQQRTILLTALDEDLEEDIAALSNLTRYFCRNMSMVDAGRAMLAASNIYIKGGKTAVLKDDNSSNAYMRIAPEFFMAYIAERKADVKVCGYKLMGSIKDINEGDKIEFVNGVAVALDNVYFNDSFTGTLTAQLIDGKMHAVISIVELMEANRVPYTVPKTLSLKLPEYAVIDAQMFAKTNMEVSCNFDKLDPQGVFVKAESLTLYPVFKYTDASGKEHTKFNAVVAVIPSLNDPSVKFTIPVCAYKCYSEVFEETFAGLQFAVINKENNADGKTAVMHITYDDSKRIDVERRTFVSESDPFEETDIAFEDYDFSSAADKKTKEKDYEDAFAPSNPAPKTSEKKTEQHSEAYEMLGESYDGEMDMTAEYEDAFC